MNNQISRQPSTVLGIGRYLMMLGVVFVVLVLAGCKTELYSGLEEEEANEMTTILLKNGISTQKIRDKKGQTYSILLDSAYFPTAIELLKTQGYPREKFLKVEDIFKKEGLISSPLEERVRYIYALSQDVQETLARIDGVVTARVHVVLPENDPFSENVKPSSASVFIRYLPDYQLEDIKAEIKLIVQKSIEGLAYDKVSVIMLPATGQAYENNDSNWTNEWGVRLPSTSVMSFRVVVWSLVLVNLLLLGVVFYLSQQLLNQDRKDDATQPESDHFFKRWLSRILPNRGGMRAQ